MSESIAAGRRCFERQAWSEAHTQLAAADAHEPPGTDDLERLAVAAYMAGEDSAWIRAWSRSHHQRLDRGDACGAARDAYWLGVILLLRRAMAPAGGGRRCIPPARSSAGCATCGPSPSTSPSSRTG